MASLVDYRRTGAIGGSSSRLKPYTATGTSWNSVSSYKMNYFDNSYLDDKYFANVKSVRYGSEPISIHNYGAQVRWAKPSAGYRNLRAENNQKLFGNALGSSSSRSRVDQYRDTSGIANKNSSSSIGDYGLRGGSASKGLFTGSKVDRSSSYKSAYSRPYNSSYVSPTVSSYSVNRFSSAPSSSGRRSSLAINEDFASTSRPSSRRNSLSSSTAALENDLTKLSQFVTDLKDNTRTMTTQRYNLSNSWPTAARTEYDNLYNSNSRRSSVSRDVSGTNLSVLNQSPCTSSVTGGLDSAYKSAAARVSSENGLYSHRNLNGSYDKWESLLSTERRPSACSSRLTDSGVFTANQSSTSSYSNQKPMTNRLASGRISRFLKPREIKDSKESDPSLSSSDGGRTTEKKRAKRKKREKKNLYKQKSSSDEEPSTNSTVKGTLDYKIMSRRRRLNRSKALLSEDAVWKPPELTYKPMRITKPISDPIVIAPIPTTPAPILYTPAPILATPAPAGDIVELIVENGCDVNTPRSSPLPPPRSGFSMSPIPGALPLPMNILDLRPLTEIERELTPNANDNLMNGDTNNSTLTNKIVSSSKTDLTASLHNCERILEQAKAQLLPNLPLPINNTYSAKNETDAKINCYTPRNKPMKASKESLKENARSKSPDTGRDDIKHATKEYDKNDVVVHDARDVHEHKSKATAKRLVVLHSDEKSTHAAFSPPFPELLTASYDDDNADQPIFKYPTPVKRTQSAGEVEIGMRPTKSLFSSKTPQPLFAAHSIIGLPSSTAIPHNFIGKDYTGAYKKPSLQELLEEFNDEVDEGDIKTANTPPFEQKISAVHVPVSLRAPEQIAAASIKTFARTQPLPEPWRQVSKQLKAIDQEMINLVTLGEELATPMRSPSRCSSISNSGFKTPEVVETENPQSAYIFDCLPTYFDSMKYSAPTEKERVQAATSISSHLMRKDIARQASQDSLATGSFATAPSECAASNDSLPMAATRSQVMTKPKSLRASIESSTRPTFGLIIAKSDQQESPSKPPAQFVRTPRSGESIFALGVSGSSMESPRSTFAGSMPTINRIPSINKDPPPWRYRKPDAQVLPVSHHRNVKAGTENVRENIRESSLQTAALKVDQMLTIARGKQKEKQLIPPNYAHQISNSYSNISKYQNGKELSLEPLNNIQEEFKRDSEMIRKYYAERDSGKEHWLYPEEPKKKPDPVWAIVGDNQPQSYLDGRQDFTRKWLENDLASLKMVDPVKPDLLQFGPRDADQRSIGSASAEIAMIISKDKHEIRRRRMQQVPDIVPQKHKAVIKPSPVKFSSYQDICSTEKCAPEPPIRKDSLSSVDSARCLLDRYLQPKLKPSYLPQSAKSSRGSQNSVRSDSHFLKKKIADQRMTNHMSNFVKRFESFDMLQDKMQNAVHHHHRAGGVGHSDLGVYAESTHSLPVDFNGYMHHQPKLLSETRGLNKLSSSSIESGADTNSTITDGDGSKLRKQPFAWNAAPVLAPSLRPGGDLLDAVDNLVAELELNTEEADSMRCSFPTQPVPRGGYDIVTMDDTPKAQRKYSTNKTQKSNNTSDGVYGSLPVLQNPVYSNKIAQQPLKPFTLSSKRVPNLNNTVQNPFQVINEERIAESRVSSAKHNFEKDRNTKERRSEPLPSLTPYRPISLSNALSPPQSTGHRGAGLSSSYGRRSPFHMQTNGGLNHQFLPISSVVPVPPLSQPPTRPFSNPDEILDATGPLGVLRRKKRDDDDDDYDNIPPLPRSNKQLQARALLNEVLTVDTTPVPNFRGGLRSPNTPIKIESHVLNSPGKEDSASVKLFKNFFRRRKGDSSSSSRDASNLSLPHSPNGHYLHKTNSYADHTVSEIQPRDNKRGKRSSKLSSWMSWKKN